jgi:hypothetical protein
MTPVGLIVAAVGWHAWPASAGAGPRGESRAAEPAGLSSPPFESVWVRVLRNVNTECKLCPAPGCMNKDWFGSSYQFQAVCRAQGARVGNTT